MAAHTILIGEDDELQRRMIHLLLTKTLDYRTLQAADGPAVLAHIEASNIDDISAVLLDLNMPGMDGFEVLRRIRLTRPDLPVLMLTGQDDTATAVKALKSGASDFLVKPPSPAQLNVALQNAIRMSHLSRELTRLKRDTEGALGFSNLIGNLQGLREVIAFSRKAASSDIPVLITGETSTGKELLARAIHGESRRVGSPFVALNCSVIPKESMKAMLIGYEKGAAPAGSFHTIGKLREAERGTVFLDDIHLLSPEAQVKLLRVLQDKEAHPIGSTKPVKINIRLISATHADLKAEVNAGRFREDLYFRLNMLTIPMPALRDRKKDILPLVDFFMQRIAATDGLPMRNLSTSAQRYLVDYGWPGNLRELQGLLHRAMVMAEDETIDRALLAQIHHIEHEGQVVAASSGMQLSLRHSNGLFKTMDTIEHEVLQLALDYHDQNVAQAATALNIAKSTFYRKIKSTETD